ncbi:hypothetical protein [Myxococcus virescens]|uniref:Lipoprotein n=1 Tax=Myxococcus virescens TaxID=83456 RepID=A0A511HLQ4_9BACT|nr:hypothetical protein [Myxococcus virescens]GEL74511.1 hypothetical protein MVI01_62950 [Myxococcus virescens]SDD71541.1 hypothetical protein SAMN04488504_102392 [Myxococcus virescens]
MSIRPRPARCRAPVRWARGAAGLLLTGLMGCQMKCSEPVPDARGAFSLRRESPCVQVWRAAQVDVAFKEEPEDAARQRTDTRLERRFTVARQLRGAYRHQDRWASVLEYEAGPVRGGVSYGLQVPDMLADLTGQVVQWTSHREPASCPTKEDGEVPVLLSGDTLRDAEGRLLLLTVPSAPTTIAGDVLLPPGLVPELGFQWEDAGCTLADGTHALDVQLRVTHANRSQGPGTTVTAEVGQPAPLTLDGVRYVVRVARATADMQGRCGQAVFTLTREDLLEQGQPGP